MYIYIYLLILDIFLDIIDLDICILKKRTLYFY